ncbi:MAG: hypothetical protein OXT67_01310 [Zetaproteobacteria bacterium]|nr:hypothetical protein [Zetaproteobacteria bacterium]
MSRHQSHTHKKKPPEKLATYKVLFFETIHELLHNRNKIIAAIQDCDQLNLVVRAESDMDNPEVQSIDPKVKLFAGAAWHLIHERRQEDGWYDHPQFWSRP